MSVFCPGGPNYLEVPTAMRKGRYGCVVWLDKAYPANIVAAVPIGMFKIRTHIARYLEVMISRAGNEIGRGLFNGIGSFWSGISGNFLARRYLGNEVTTSPNFLIINTQKRMLSKKNRVGTFSWDVKEKSVLLLFLADKSYDRQSRQSHCSIEENRGVLIFIALQSFRLALFTACISRSEFRLLVEVAIANLVNRLSRLFLIRRGRILRRCHLFGKSVLADGLPADLHGSHWWMTRIERRLPRSPAR
jgi:hypothetical protein